ncbi:hypothetical protein QBC34DRAFT_64058 [Podospora aff. communis PSN243]|uniref:Rhodopsin domain-containing protein n=1 Tax=Podospora aff. communis PSN243 TaxID=3040156 RepID=A0AAV9GPG4_9PEZI|nr:hypothetical protein QBC34DRAFT_64058 [Podospora aff. communis PSN243]
MPLYSEPPPLTPFSDDKPTLLVCWWITIFCAVIILLRVSGRFVRTEKLFAEDKTAAFAVVPLFLRMGCVHAILILGTNNAQLADANLPDDVLHRKSIASGLVLLSRVLYAATLWTFKLTILEFFKRLNVTWERSYDVGLSFIRCTLAATFVAVIISDLAECRPFAHYWQVLPDPGGQCRQGYAQLLTMAVCNILTDLLLVFFPIPIIIRSQMSSKRKVQLVLLFSLSLVVVAITLYRVPEIIRAHGSQQTRSLYASVELLFATAASNALVLGSFVRDRGVKKRKFKYDSIAAGSMERSSGTESRRPTLRHWGSDEDLVRDVGYGVKPDLREPLSPTTGGYIPARVAKMHEEMNSWNFPGQKRASAAHSAAHSDDPLLSVDGSSRSNSTATPRKVSFFDQGNLLSSDEGSSRRGSYANGPLSPGALPSPSKPAGASGVRRGSTALLQDIGGLLSPLSPRLSKPRKKSAPDLSPVPGSREETPTSNSPPTSPPEYPKSPPAWKADIDFVDAGGLLKK